MTKEIQHKGFDYIYFMTTNRCNLKCEYCYESIRKGDATEEIGKQSIDWFRGQENIAENPGRWKNITFFGGEPLLKPKLIKSMIDYAVHHEDPIDKFSILTNGTLWNKDVEETVRYMKENSDHCNLQISLDGGKESHDRYRVFPDGSGSFDTVVENISKFKNIIENISIRQTVCPENVQNMSKDFQLMCELAGEGSNVSLTPIVEGDWNDDVIKVYAEEMGKVLDIYSNIDKKIFFNLLYNMKERNCYAHKRQKRGCSAGQKLACVNPQGDIYPCHRFASYKDIVDTKIGDVWSGVDFTNEYLVKIRDAFGNVKKCNGCKAMVCNACMATNLALGEGLEFRPPEGYCQTALSIHDKLEKTTLEFLRANKMVLRYKELYKTDIGGFFRMDKNTNLEYVDDMDLFAKSFVEIFKKLSDLKTDTTLIKKELGLPLGNEGVKKDENPVC